MSDLRSSSSDGASGTQKRNLPSWMSSRGTASKSRRKIPNDDGQNEERTGHVRAQSGNASLVEGEPNSKPSVPSSNNTNFSKLLEGVVFVLSGFVNPERSTLRSQGLEMGAEYRADWDPNCTLLVCAFQNTPKFRQVEADCGTIVSKEWILECYSQKKLVDIDPFLMHAGKPWQKNSISDKISQDKKESSPRKSNKQVEKGSKSKPNSALSKDKEASHPARDNFSPSQVKKWAIDDFKRTVSWLESQEEKPDPSEIKHVAAEGILTCLQDAIDSLEQKQDMRQVTEQWNFIPLVVEELLKFEGSHGTSLSKEDLCRKAKAFKRVYEDELSRLDGSSSNRGKRKIDGGEGAARYDSDETIEMTEEDIDIANKNAPPIVWMKSHP